ncbi:unnamed protein product [[Candida] boidinii]|uniref:Unnamed protein product n=1 Tax=Candida boidinii TaxID=5477 RepID=A0ACB5U9T7_CANBO|nr:unnamed protein product [[Candida] boidinii]
MKENESDSELQPPSPKAGNNETEQQFGNINDKDNENENDNDTKLNKSSTFSHFRRSMFGKNVPIPVARHDSFEDGDIRAVSDLEQQNEQEKQQQDNNNHQQQHHEHKLSKINIKKTQVVQKIINMI